MGGRTLTPPAEKEPPSWTLHASAVTILLTLGTFTGSLIVEKIIDPLVRHESEIKTLGRDVETLTRSVAALSARVEHGTADRDQLQQQVAALRERADALRQRLERIDGARK